MHRFQNSAGFIFGEGSAGEEGGEVKDAEWKSGLSLHSPLEHLFFLCLIVEKFKASFKLVTSQNTLFYSSKPWGRLFACQILPQWKS